MSNTVVFSQCTLTRGGQGLRKGATRRETTCARGETRTEDKQLNTPSFLRSSMMLHLHSGYNPSLAGTYLLVLVVQSTWKVGSVLYFVSSFVRGRVLVVDCSLPGNVRSY